MWLFITSCLIFVLSRRFKDLQSLGGINHVKPYTATGLVSELSSNCKASKLFLGTRGSVQTRATVISGEGGILSSSGGNAVVANNTILDDQPGSASIGSSFPIDEDEYDFDRPTEGFASVADAIEDVRQGKVVHYSSFFSSFSTLIFTFSC